jgi:hypothetical protein
MSSLIKHFWKAREVTDMIQQLMHAPVLGDLITAPYGNFVINCLVDIEPRLITEAVKLNFPTIAQSIYGNHIIHRCLSSEACKDYIPSLEEAFRQHEETQNYQ